MKKFLALLLAVVMVLSLAACGSQPTATPSATEAPAADATEAPATSEPLAADTYLLEDFDAEGYTDESSAVYQEVLGEFDALFEEAKGVQNVSERYALMAIAEAKLLESGVLLPASRKGGNYAISRVAPYTVNSTLWGNDSERFHDALVATEPITKADRDELRTMWNELKGTGTYLEKTAEYLTGKGYELKDSYTLGYASDPVTWDALATSRSADSEAIVNTFDGLMEYDVENVQQPALAESYEVSEDGLVYTFHLRSGAVWVDSQGRKVADVKADDFVAGMQHMLDAAGGLEYLVCSPAGGGCGIVGTDDYVNQVNTDFSAVGVKALDELTVEYTLTEPCSFFLTMLGYNCFAPMSREYFLSQGGGFGADYAPDSETYLYGKTPENIAYCGPYLVKNNTAESTITFVANPSYWNADGINIHTLTWLFNDGTDATKAYTDTMAGTLDGAGLNASAVEAAKNDGVFDELAYTSLTDATAFSAFVNVNRHNFSNATDTTSVRSTQTVSQADRTALAVKNQAFRQALLLAVDRAAYNAQSVGEELKLTSLCNSYTPGNFVFLDEEATVDINGTATTYPAGTFYGEILQAQLDADGFPIKVWDAELGTGDGFDGWYNPEAAAEYLDKAISELGIEITAENPIYLDLPAFTASESFYNKANAFKQSVEAALGGKVIINLTECVDSNAWYYSGYYTDYGYEANYDVYDVSGWGPDYGDPATYLNTMLPDYSGYMAKCLGLF